MKCDMHGCNNHFQGGQRIFVSKNDEKQLVHLCSEACRDAFEKKLKQLDLVPERSYATFKLEDATMAGCQIGGISIAPTSEGGEKIKLALILPGGFSIDEIRHFSGTPIKVMLFREHIEYDKKPEKAGKVVKEDLTGGKKAAPKKAGKTPELTLPDPAQNGPVENILIQLLTDNDDSAREFAVVQANGISDNDLDTMIGSRFTSDIRTIDGHQVETKGGANPLFAIDGGKALRGRLLVGKVRAVLALPQPKEE